MPSTPRPDSQRVALRRGAVLFSDVDGTLLDEEGRYAVTPRQVSEIATCVELVLTSSRTIPELLEIQRDLGLRGPLIAENGALLSFPPGWRGTRVGTPRRIAGEDLRVVALGERAARLRPIVRRCAARVGVRPVEQRDTLPDLGRAIGRTHSILLRENAPPRQWAEFQSLLGDRGLDASHSGRWLAVTKGADKGTGARFLLALAARRGAPYGVAAAVGNAENDIALLAAVERPFVIRNPRQGHDPALASLPRAHLLRAVGIAGWPEALARTLTGIRRT